MEVADESEPLSLRPDRRPMMPEPLPVRLIAVEDVVLLTAPGRETLLNGFYVDLLRMEREDDPPPVRPATEPVLGGSVPVLPTSRLRRPLPAVPADAIQGPVYRAENRRISFHVIEPPVERETLRPVGIEVPSLVSVRLQIEQLEIEYARQKGLYPGQDSLLLKDPGGNWVEISESRPI